MKTKKIFMAGALAFSMVLSGGMLTGCSNSSSTNDTKTSEVAKKKEVKTLGQKTKDSKSLKFTNNTGKKITVFETKSSSEENNSSTSSSKPSNSGSNNSGTSKPSNNSGSSSNNSKPAEHTHNWVAITETRTVVDQAAYDEQVPVTEMREHEICSSCGADLTGTDASAHVYQHMINGDDKGGWHSEWREEVTGYQTVHHDAVTHTETVITGYRCSTCGATK